MASTEEGGGNAVGKDHSEPSEAAPQSESAEAPKAETPDAAAAESHPEPEPEPAPSSAEAAPAEESALAAAAVEPVAAADTLEPEPPAPPRRAWLWVAAVLVGAAAIGLTLGALLGGRQGGPLASQAGGNGRPTIVVGTAAVGPSAVASVPSPSPSTVVAGATPGASASARAYVVQPGDTLRSIAQDQYGDATQWPKIYQANRDQIGNDPDALVAGQTLQIPPP